MRKIPLHFCEASPINSRHVQDLIAANGGSPGEVPHTVIVSEGRLGTGDHPSNAEIYQVSKPPEAQARDASLAQSLGDGTGAHKLAVAVGDLGDSFSDMSLDHVAQSLERGDVQRKLPEAPLPEALPRPFGMTMIPEVQEKALKELEGLLGHPVDIDPTTGQMRFGDPQDAAPTGDVSPSGSTYGPPIPPDLLEASPPSSPLDLSGLGEVLGDSIRFNTSDSHYGTPETYGVPQNYGDPIPSNSLSSRNLDGYGTPETYGVSQHYGGSGSSSPPLDIVLQSKPAYIPPPPPVTDFSPPIQVVMQPKPYVPDFSPPLHVVMQSKPVYGPPIPSSMMTETYGPPMPPSFNTSWQPPSNSFFDFGW